MVLVVFVIVVMRYVFDSGMVWLQESLTWMHAMAFMLGAAYTLQQEEHVRVDIFYREMSERRRAIVDLAGVLFIKGAQSIEGCKKGSRHTTKYASQVIRTQL